MTNTAKFASIRSFVTTLLADLDDRQREVIKARYGLGESDPVTLQVVGDRYGITRERVRQIEAGSLDELRARAKHPYLASFTKAAAIQLKKVGGAQRDGAFLAALHRSVGDRGTFEQFQHPARFVLELTGAARRYRDSYGTWHPFWYLTPEDRKRAEKFVARLVTDLRRKKREVLDQNRFSDVLTENVKLAKVAPAAAQSYLAISRQIAENPFGQIGLTDWEEINPKTTRDWAYLILKREQKPLHFSALASTIAQHRIGKRTNTQTVHNELIKDDRFVLVGRGLYGLSEFGLIPGTAREIIAHVLRQHGPLTSPDVVKKVKEQRILKEGTILINLQNKKHFRCMEDGRYCIAEV